MSDELKPCPFCDGDKFVIGIVGGENYVWCKKCGARCEGHKTINGAKEKWNTRPIEKWWSDYADKLVEALPSDFLPKDIENIRTANCHMADKINALTAELAAAQARIVELECDLEAYTQGPEPQDFKP